MRIVTVVGARPQFIKAAAVSRVIRPKIEEIFIHTGQHYDENMSNIFFNEMKIPQPDYNLGVGSGSHAKQTADMMVGIEKILLEEKPDYLMVYGDTNSTLAGALAAIKIHIPVIHIEAGLRSFNMAMPEEINRILTDRISDILCCPTDTAVENLRKEGIIKGVYNIGDVMCDAVKFYLQTAEMQDKRLHFNRLLPMFDCEIPVMDEWYLATVHRAENTDSALKIETILNAFERLDAKVLFPVHPRTKSLVQAVLSKKRYRNTLFCQPVGYFDMLYFANLAKKIVTDSGGLQKEAYIMDTPCITVREQTEWVETLEGKHNVLTHLNTDDIVDKVMNTKVSGSKKQNYYGNGDAALRLLQVLESVKQ